MHRARDRSLAEKRFAHELRRRDRGFRIALVLGELANELQYGRDVALGGGTQRHRFIGRAAHVAHPGMKGEALRTGWSRTIRRLGQVWGIRQNYPSGTLRLPNDLADPRGDA